MSRKSHKASHEQCKWCCLYFLYFWCEMGVSLFHFHTVINSSFLSSCLIIKFLSFILPTCVLFIVQGNYCFITIIITLSGIHKCTFPKSQLFVSTTKYLTCETESSEFWLFRSDMRDHNCERYEWNLVQSGMRKKTRTIKSLNRTFAFNVFLCNLECF